MYLSLIINQNNDKNDNVSLQHVDRAKQNARYYCEKLGAYRMPFAWTAVHLLNIINGANSIDPNPDNTDVDKVKSNSLDSRKKSIGVDHSFGSLPRKPGEPGVSASVSGGASGSLKRSGSERRSFYKVEDDAENLDSFHPVMITVSSFFKQVGVNWLVSILPNIFHCNKFCFVF